MCHRHGNTYERNALSFNGFCEALLLIARRTGGPGAGKTKKIGRDGESRKTGVSRNSGGVAEVGGVAKEAGETGERSDRLNELELLLNQCEREIVQR